MPIRFDSVPYLGPLLSPLLAPLQDRADARTEATAAAIENVAGRTAAAGGGLAVLALKSAVDRAACAYRLVCGPNASRDDWPRIAPEVDGARRLFSSRGWIEKPQKYHETPPALDEAQIAPVRSRGRSYLSLRFESGYAPRLHEPGRDRWLSYAANRTALAWVLRHQEGRRPWLVCIHGYGMGYPIVDFEAFPVRWLHDTLGLNIVMPVLPLHGPRKVGRISGERFLDSDLLDTIHAEAQAMWDIRRVLSWVQTQEPASIGVYGLSLGGYTASLLAGLEPGLACVIAGIPATDFLRLAMLHTRSATMRCAERAGLVWNQVAELLRVISPLATAPRVPHDRLFMFAGTRDRLVPADHVTELWNHWKRPRMAWYHGSHFSFLWEPETRSLVREALTMTMIGADDESRQAAA